MPGNLTFYGQSLEIRQTSRYRIVLVSNSDNLHFSNDRVSQYGFVCDSMQSQTPIIYLSSSGQSSLCDRRFIHKLE